MRDEVTREKISNSLMGHAVLDETKEKISKSLEGNINAASLKDEEIMKIAFQSYCDHLASGFTKRSWAFDDDRYPDVCVVGRTMEEYIKKYPTVMPPSHIERAESKGRKYWEGVIQDSALGRNKEINTNSLNAIMRNVCDWDKKSDTQITEKHEPGFRETTTQIENS